MTNLKYHAPAFIAVMQDRLRVIEWNIISLNIPSLWVFSAFGDFFSIFEF